MQLSAVRIFVRSLPEARAFYAGILALPLKLDGGEKYGFLQFDAGTADLIIEIIKPEEPAQEQALVARFTGVSFDVSDIAAEHQRLKSLGVVFTDAPAKMFWGGYLATFKDPAGNELQLVQRPELLAR